MSSPAVSTVNAAAWPAAWVRRLREVHRSAGWSWGDALELDLLAAGLLQREGLADSASRVGLTPTGVTACASARSQHRASVDPHHALADAVAAHLHAQGRWVWRELTLRAGLVAQPKEKLAASAANTPQLAIDFVALDEPLPVRDDHTPRRWVMVRPDVFSIRPSSRADGLEPWVFEVKARRADLRADLARPDKRAAYAALGRTWYVLGCDAQGRAFADADDVPADFGVWQAVPRATDTAPSSAPGHAARWSFQALRAAPLVAPQTGRPDAHQALPVDWAGATPARGLPLGVWLALARGVPWGHATQGPGDMASQQPIVAV
jgi:hypothetical protein